MGCDKRMLQLGGRSFLEIALEKAVTFSDDVILSVGGDEQLLGLSETASLSVKVVFDRVSGCGPLEGLLRSLPECGHEYAALMPVDAPLLTPRIYLLMKDKLGQKQGLSGVVPKGLYGLEPLHGVYNSDRFLEACSELARSGGARLREALGKLDNIVYMDLDEFRVVDPKLLSFQNINTPLDLERLKGEMI